MKKRVSILQKKHEGKWVALSLDGKRVIGFSDNLVALEKKVGRDKVMFTKALHSDTTYAF